MSARRVKEESGLVPKLANDNGYQEAEAKLLKEGYQLDDAIIKRAQEFTLRRTVKETDRATYQAMEALVHNLNTMHSRAGAQIPFSSINYGMDTSPEGRMAVKTSCSPQKQASATAKRRFSRSTFSV